MKDFFGLSANHNDIALKSVGAPSVAKRKRKAWFIAGLAVLLFSAGVILLVPYVLNVCYMHGINFKPVHSVLYTIPCVVENRLAEYGYNDIYKEISDAFLERKKGDVLTVSGKYTVYKMKGRDNLLHLIFDDGKSLTYCEFRSFLYSKSYNSDEEWREAMKSSPLYNQYGYLTDENLSYLVNDPYTLEFVLETIYNVNSAEDIVKIKFEKIEKSQFGNTAEEKAGIVKTVTLRNEADITRFYGILCSLNGNPHIK